MLFGRSSIVGLMGHPHITKKTTNKIGDILTLAAKMILKGRKKEVDIAELAKQAGISRPSIHAVFGRGENVSAKTAIYRRITDEFFNRARNSIEIVLLSLPPTSTPIERLISVFRTTLNMFESHNILGAVILQEATLSHDEENPAVFRILAQVDEVISEAREQGQLNERAQELRDFEIRHIIFTVTRGLLGAHYLQECFRIAEDGSATSDFGLQLIDIEIEVLRILQLYCSDKAKQKINDVITAIRNESTAKKKVTNTKGKPAKAKG